MKYFFDNNISPKFPLMLRALGENVVALREEFPESVDDPTFLIELKGVHDIYITYDHKQRTREAEASAIK